MNLQVNKDRVSGSQIFQEGRDQRHGLLGSCLQRHRWEKPHKNSRKTRTDRKHSRTTSHLSPPLAFLVLTNSEINTKAQGDKTPKPVVPTIGPQLLNEYVLPWAFDCGAQALLLLSPALYSPSQPHGRPRQALTSSKMSCPERPGN